MNRHRPSLRARIVTALLISTALGLGLAMARAAESAGVIEHDADRKLVTLADGTGNLVLRLNYDGKCMLDQVVVRGRNVIQPSNGVSSAIKVAGTWHTTRQGIPTPKVALEKNVVTVTGIVCGGGGVDFKETWSFTVQPDGIRWRLGREYRSGSTVEDAAFPGWEFTDMSTWTGALLGNGGVAWCKLFDSPQATYGVHTGEVTFWNRERGACLRIAPSEVAGRQLAVRFSRQPNHGFGFSQYVTREPLVPRHGLRRFLRDRQDVWSPWKVDGGVEAVELTLEALDYDQAYDRGRLTYFRGASIREILHTIARIGAIDEEIMGSNGYYSGYAVLHEPWIAQLGLAIDDAHYFAAYARTLDYQRDHAIGADGRVKSRWAYDAGDAVPGTYDSHGFYECQWGWLMDSQPSYVINVAEQFDFTGDVEWARRHKSTCENVLGYLLRRDSDGDGLVEMMTASPQAAKGSDWLDVIWAAFENAFVNAQMYHALVLWAEVESVLGDNARAKDFRQRAEQLKVSFNRPTTEGGFWNAEKKWFVYWRDQDGAVHGDNLTLPVNFMAIAYGLCEDPGRARAILDRTEQQMEKEGLFFWPICLFSFAEGEGHPSQFPFPAYENGDLFLAWGEVGTRSYAKYKPAIAVKYIKNVLDQYERDGLACQRYLRKSQRGEGGDILSNNCSPVVGLYRNIYGLQPRWNRLYLEPHLTPELNCTQLRYWLRGHWYDIGLSVDDYRIIVNGFAVRGRAPFGVNASAQGVEYFTGERSSPSLTLTRSGAAPIEVTIESWPDEAGTSRQWSVACQKETPTVGHVVFGLQPDAQFSLHCNGALVGVLNSDRAGHVKFRHTITEAREHTFELKP